MALVPYVDSMDGLLAQLDATSARGFKENAIRSSSGPRIPYLHEVTNLAWRPPPKMDDLREKNNASPTRFKQYVKNAGSAFAEPAYPKPKLLNMWVAERAVQPDRTHETNHSKSIAPPRSDFQSRPLPEPTDEILGDQHRDWLQLHYKEHEAKAYPIAHALNKVHKAKTTYEAHAAMREMTRDMVTRQPKDQAMAPKLGLNAKRGLAKAMVQVKIGRNFKGIMGKELDPLKEEEAKDKKILIKARSAPALRFYESVPAARPEHLRRFAYTTQALRRLRESTPWQHYDETLDLKKLGRKTW